MNVSFGAVERAVESVFAQLDWRALGEIYFHEDGEQHWREKAERAVSLGLELGRRVLSLVPETGASLWVGAGVAELPALLAETMRTQRRVVAANLRADECELLNRAIERAAVASPLRFVAGDAADVGEGPFDHLGCISVFTDPEVWPTLSGVAYGRLPPPQLDVEAFVAEREAAQGLAARLFARLQRPGLVTTTPEEVAWFLGEADRAGVAVEALDDLIETAVVGDPVGFLRLG